MKFGQGGGFGQCILSSLISCSFRIFLGKAGVKPFLAFLILPGINRTNGWSLIPGCTGNVFYYDFL